MSSTGLLVVSNIKNIRSSIAAVKNYVKSLYIHLNVPPSTNPPVWASEVVKVYAESLCSGCDIDVKVLVSPLKIEGPIRVPRKIDVFFSDGKFPDVCESLQRRYNISLSPVFLSETSVHDLVPTIKEGRPFSVYKNVVLGGTFDRIHVGHKILLTEAVLRACKRLVVGVTTENMVKSKRLWELILPVENRIKDVYNFLTDIDDTLQYEVVPIDDPFGPTKNDPNMDLIIVSSETLRGGHKVNELRMKNGLNPLEIYCINMVEIDVDTSHKENKISSGNTRLDLLGTRLRPVEPRPNLPREPYIIGFTGGIASGKSKMVSRFKEMGAFVMDCDKLAHELYEPSQICYDKIIEHFGRGILDDKGNINRQALGSIVFADPKQLETLSNIIWPELILEAKKRVYEAYQKQKFKVAILEAAVLLKAGWEEHYHEVWSTIVNPDEVVKRLKERNNLSEEEARKRIAAQLDNKTVVSRSHVVFSSEWSYEYSEEQAKRAWNMLMKELESR